MAADPWDSTVTEALRAWRVQHEAGVPGAAALRTAAEVCRSPQAQSCFLEAAHQAEQGADAAALLESLAGVLADSERAALAAGFRAGRVEAALDAVVERRELWAGARRRIRSRLVLPWMVLVLAALIAPLPAWVLTGDGWAYLLRAACPIALAVAAWLAWSRMERARLLAPHRAGPDGEPTPASHFDRLLLSLPLARTMERLRNLGEFAGLLSTLVGSGVVLSEALAACARALPNGVYRAEVYRCSRLVQSGQPLSAALAPGRLWPREFVTALQAAEKAGALEETCARFARAWSEQYAAAVDQFTAWLPRVLYAVVCVYVIYLIVSLLGQLAPLYQGQ